MRIPVNMTTEELDVCPVCTQLVYKTEGALVDVMAGNYADTDVKHEHQPRHVCVSCHGDNLPGHVCGKQHQPGGAN